MALPASGQIDLNAMHVEVGGTTGTECSINDADIRAINTAGDPGAGGAQDFADYYGASASTVAINGGSISSHATTGHQYAGFRFNADGTIDRFSTQLGGYAKYDDWIVPNSAAAADTYEIYCTYTGDSLLDNAGMSTWLDLDTSPLYRLRDNTQDDVGKTGTLTVSIRKNGGATLDTGDYTLSANYLSIS